MTGPEYTAALTALSLTPDQAAIWLGIGRSTAYRYLKTGCEGAVARCLEMAVGVMDARTLIGARLDTMSEIDREVSINRCWHGLTAAVGLPDVAG